MQRGFLQASDQLAAIFDFAFSKDLPNNFREEFTMSLLCF